MASSGVRPIKVLVLIAEEGPDDSPHSGMRELRVIRDATASAGSSVEVKDYPAVELNKILGYLAIEQPQIVHIVAHGLEFGKLRFGGAQALPKDLVEVMANGAESLECLILSACNFNQSSADYSTCCKSLIGCKGELDPDAAIEFASGFYTKLASIVSVGAECSIEKCAQAGTAHAKLLRGMHYKELGALKLLMKPKVVRFLRDRIEPVLLRDNLGKARSFFGLAKSDSVQRGTLAELAGTFDCIKSDRRLLDLLNRLRAQAFQLYRFASRQTLANPIVPSSEDEANANYSLDSVDATSVDGQIVLLKSTFHLLYKDAKEVRELKPAVDHVTRDEVDTVRAALLCKLEQYECCPSNIEDLCASMRELASYHFKFPEDQMLLEEMCNKLALALLELIEALRKCITDRLTGTTKATLKYGIEDDSEQGLDQVVKNLPHHQDLERPGKVLWQLQTQHP